ncbi:MAG: hypothetical protein U9P70_03725 [Patescibacteria group bacterium]|nr:hypothetical protein [Patescibacteria group bacterium]
MQEKNENKIIKYGKKIIAFMVIIFFLLVISSAKDGADPAIVLYSFLAILIFDIIYYLAVLIFKEKNKYKIIFIGLIVLVVFLHDLPYFPAMMLSLTVLAAIREIIPSLIIRIFLLVVLILNLWSLI